MNHYDYSNTIAKADSRARGDRLKPLYNICDGKSRVSTKQVLQLVEQLEESEKQDAIHFRALADKLHRLEHTQ